MKFSDLLKLDRIFGNKLVIILYYAGLAFSVIGGITQFIAGVVAMFNANIVGGLWQIICSPFIIAFGLLVVRVVCEALTVIFNKYD